MTKETSYERYKRVLGEIADGADNPQERATEALRNHKPVPSKWTEQAKAGIAARAKEIARIKGERLAHAQEMYVQWMRAGRAPIASFAKHHKVGISFMKRLLCLADKQLPEDQRRLMWSYRTKDYKTVSEVKHIYRIRDIVMKECGFGKTMDYDLCCARGDAIDTAVDKTCVGSGSDKEWISAAIAYMRKHHPNLMGNNNESRAPAGRSDRAIDAGLRKP